MYILGISCFYHDSAAVLIRDGKLIAAAQEERFSRKKHDDRFPQEAINYCLREAGISAAKLDSIGFYEKPFLKFDRILQTYLHTAPKGVSSFVQSMPLWMKEKLWMKHIIQRSLAWDREVVFIPHHLAHAASAFLVSPFTSAAILTLDGVGEWSTTTKGFGSRNSISLTHEIRFPHSLGLLYSAFTFYCGFKVNSGEYKLMGLAPYGKPRFASRIRESLIDVKADGSFQLNMDYFPYEYSLRMINKRFIRLFNHVPARASTDPITQHHRDVAASIQSVLEEIILRLTRSLSREVKSPNLCMAGGVALNCVANGKILRESPFHDLYVQPAAGDAGGALGVAYYIYNCILKHPRNFVMEHVYFGPHFSNTAIESFLKHHNVPYHSFRSQKKLYSTVAKKLARQRVVGWFQGRMEWGPRALGNRSILADPRNPENQKRVNLKIKFREDFRPFAPSVLEEYQDHYFKLSPPSPFMLLVAQVRGKRRSLPAVTHVDGSARIHSVNARTNPSFHRLLESFRRETDCPVLINTSFNVRGEPIVCTPEDAFRCFMGTEMDDLVMGNYLIRKESVKVLSRHHRYRDQFQLD
ncbi:MAG: hypothetical protein A2785_02705 [Candidatus Chisholmbacteria bacterium RIFCSPHIGHO2_01_FULL_49_18]|uniref:Carbamoyltransferase n=1 Tax=Candidatus Chisholmbacteria bacterium RIFCSPHIGHO2_01_FULL_49_18 TaxID=1797590 RepID=A0A1G1VL03_9BACT|nr:MAG: hypothetical protein A2785_02705 [Candidatus Chisholmbacteria bacterium RIFCSPHIGHO2_01_FULL_49_18]